MNQAHRNQGTGPDGTAVRLCGIGCTVVRAQPDGVWRIAADAWCLAGEVPRQFPHNPSWFPQWAKRH